MSSTRLEPLPLTGSLAGPSLPPRQAGLFYDPVLRMGISWLDGAAPRPVPRSMPASGQHARMVQAVAGIVAIAAERARQNGELPALRDALERALGQNQGESEPTDPREQGLPEPAPIHDADRGNEGERLGTLLRRQSRR
jgi:hypothetical protein